MSDPSTRDLTRQMAALHDTLTYVCCELREVRKLVTPAPKPRVIVHQPNGDIHVSGNQPTALAPVTIIAPAAGSSQSPGWVAVNPIGIANSDGTAPSVALSNPGTINGSAVSGPDAAGNYGWSGTAAVPGNVTVTFSADGVPNYTLAVTVVAATDETLTIAPTAVTTGAPGTTPPAFT